MSKRKKKQRKKKKEEQVASTHTPSLQSKPTPKLVIPFSVWQKIMYWTDKADAEVSGFGSLSYDNNTNTFTVVDAILLKQEVTGSDTEIDAHAIGKAMFELKDQPNALKWHWHSHVNMGVFWSGDDQSLIRQLGQQGWILATVVNRKREHKSAFYTTVRCLSETLELFNDEIPCSVEAHVDDELTREWDKEYTDKVSRKTYTPTIYTPSYDTDERWNRYSREYDRIHGKDDNGKKITAIGETEEIAPAGQASLCDLDKDYGPDSPPDGVEYVKDPHYDEQGYKAVDDFEDFKYIYNPHYDNDIHEIGDLHDAIWDMSQRCHEYLMATDKHYHAYFNWMISYYPKEKKDDRRTTHKTT